MIRSGYNKLTEASKMDDIEKLKRIIKSHGQLSDKGNWVIMSALTVQYVPSNDSIIVMDPMWGYPRYVCKSGNFYKQAIDGSKKNLTKATLIRNALDQIKSGSKLIDYTDDGELIKSGNKHKKLNESKCRGTQIHNQLTCIREIEPQVTSLKDQLEHVAEVDGLVPYKADIDINALVSNQQFITKENLIHCIDNIDDKIKPVTVFHIDGLYVITDGNHRANALLHEDIPTIPAEIYDIDADDSDEAVALVNHFKEWYK